MILAVRNSLKFILEVEGFQVRIFSSAEELLNEDSLPDASCLVVDYYMPGMKWDGNWSLTSAIGMFLIPAILITPAPSDNLRNRAATAGVPIVEKPLLGSRLLDFDPHGV